MVCCSSFLDPLILGCAFHSAGRAPKRIASRNRLGVTSTLRNVKDAFTALIGKVPEFSQGLVECCRRLQSHSNA